jgi:hypothetical protein
MRQARRRLVTWMFRLEARPDPVLATQHEEEVDRAAAE